MTPDALLTTAIRPALAILPPAMTSRAAESMLLAIAWQESRAQYRRQIRGPARGLWQFERAGVLGVRTHRATRDHYRHVLGVLSYDRSASTAEVQRWLEHADVLAAALARLLLWTLPMPLPREDEPGEGWAQYLRTWNPGKPKPATWEDAWAFGWTI